MDIHPTPFPGKAQTVRSKYNRKIVEEQKTKAKEPINRQKRVFGTTRNPNIPAKTITEKPTKKPQFLISQKQPKSEQPIPSSTNVAAVSVTVTPKHKSPEITQNLKSAEFTQKQKSPKFTPKQNSPEKNRAGPKKKSVCFKEKVGENTKKKSEEGDIVGPQTPVRSPSLVKPRVSGTPYHSAKRCSDCRFDRLETSSYWLGQIRLAESVGKHFVSVAFFRLAFESKAEPYRILRVELKRYLARHEYLSAEMEWRDVSRSYGLLKDESNGAEVDSDSGKPGTSNATGEIHDQEELKEEAAEESETKRN